jgi:hypothetical protein
LFPQQLAEALLGVGWASEPTTELRGRSRVNSQECRVVKFALKHVGSSATGCLGHGFAGGPRGVG